VNYIQQALHEFFIFNLMRGGRLPKEKLTNVATQKKSVPRLKRRRHDPRRRLQPFQPVIFILSSGIDPLAILRKRSRMAENCAQTLTPKNGRIEPLIHGKRLLVVAGPLLQRDAAGGRLSAGPFLEKTE
jgi:hypothetical protein